MLFSTFLNIWGIFYCPCLLFLLSGSFQGLFLLTDFFDVIGYIFIPGHFLMGAKHHLRGWVLDFLVLLF